MIRESNKDQRLRNYQIFHSNSKNYFDIDDILLKVCNYMVVIYEFCVSLIFISFFVCQEFYIWVIYFYMELSRLDN